VPLVLTPLDAAGLFLAVDDSTVLADGLASAMIIAVVTDVFGHPVAPGTDVNFVTTRGVLLDILPTDSTGVASARLRSERFDTGTARVTVSASGFHQAIDVQFVSEEAAHIEVVSVDPTQIGVVGTGQPEVSTITFEVRDANGIPVDAGHAATLAFEVFSTGETTDATIHPASAVTGQEGRAIATVNAGTISGVVQIQASTGEVNARPIAVAIHSGLPDPLHFSLAFEKVNVAGLVYSGLSDGVTAFVGDKHGNPVSEGTMVWFHTSGGIVGPSAATNAMGTATVTSLTAEPRPGSDGLVAICAKTVPAPEYVAQYGDTVEVCGNVLWSGATTIEVVSPSVLDVPNGGSVPVRFRVADDNGNPLTEGTTISVETTAGELFGQTDVTLPDTQSPDLTVFEVLLSDDDPGTVQTRSIWLTISVVSQNGDAAIFYPGTIH
jgi:hypothetical protein